MTLLKKIKQFTTAALTSLAIIAAPQQATAASGIERTVEEWADGKGAEKLASFATTVGINMILCSTFRGIKTKKDSKDFWKGFATGLGHGAVAGAIEGIGMEIASYNEKTPGMGALGRIIFNAGVSASYNSMAGRSILTSYEIDIGPIILSMEFKKGIKGLNFFIDPSPAGEIIAEIARGHKFEPERLLYDLTFAFSFDGTVRSPFLRGFSVGGYTAANIPTFSKDFPGAISHENIHTLQYASFRSTDAIYPFSDFRKLHFALGAPTTLLATILHFVPIYLINSDAYLYNPIEWQAFALGRE